MLAGLGRWVASKFSYDAINHKGRRRNPGSRVVREDAHLPVRPYTFDCLVDGLTGIPVAWCASAVVAQR
jgi:hypothetical protein